MVGYEALRERAGWLDLSARGRIRATGEDRVRLLHAMTTNHIEQLKPGDGCYAFFLNAQGRILADTVLLALEDSLLLDTEPETRAGVYEHLDRYIIADDVTLEDVTDETVQIGIEGPGSEAILQALGAPAPAAPYSHDPWGSRRVVRFSTTGLTGFSIIAPAAEKDSLIRELEAAGAEPADAEAARVVRLELGRPRYGEDITDRYLPHETQVLSALHFSKGCYLGQEIVERVRSRGGVHRFLVPLEIEGRVAPDRGVPIATACKNVGEITSAAYSPARGKIVALGYVRLDEIPPGAALAVGENAAVLTEPKPLDETALPTN
jgi:tRNA-modifying protein YgfZ